MFIEDFCLFPEWIALKLTTVIRIIIFHWTESSSHHLVSFMFTTVRKHAQKAKMKTKTENGKVLQRNTFGGYQHGHHLPCNIIV